MRITLIALALITTLGLAACNKKADVAATSEMTDEQKTFYAGAASQGFRIHPGRVRIREARHG